MIESDLAEAAAERLAMSVLAWSLTSQPTCVRHQWMLYCMTVAEAGQLEVKSAGLCHKSICSDPPDLVEPHIVGSRAKVLLAGVVVVGVVTCSVSLQLPTDLF